MTKRAILWLAVSTEAQADDDKASLPKQREEALALCEKNGWRVVDILEVPGHSRRYIDIHKCAADMLKEGIDAFDKLLRHWENQDFDVLVVRDGSRFARTQSLHAYIVETTIESGAEIYSLADGLINESNYRMYIIMAGYASASEVDNLVKRRKMGFEARVKRGLPANAEVPISHKLIRDEKSGKAIRVELNEEMRRVWDDLATLILEGISWQGLEVEMYNRFGHANSLGEPNAVGTYYRLIYSPTFWGNSAYRFKYSRRGPWVYQEGEPVPEGVTIYYNTHQGVWEGDIAEQVKAELRRRGKVIRGRAKPSSTTIFSGLFICGECGWHLTYTRKNNWMGWYCHSRYWETNPDKQCRMRKTLTFHRAKGYIHKRLEQMLEQGNPAAFLPVRVIVQSILQSR